MKTKLTALSLCILLCSNSIIPTVLAASTPTPSSNVPMLKTAISQNLSNVELTMGKAHVLRLTKPASRVSISNPDIVSLVMISPTEVQLIGKAVGVANLLVWGENSGSNYLTVDLSVHRDVSTLARKIQLIDPGINILPVAAEDSVILTGVAESAEKAQLAHDVAKAFFAKEAAAVASQAGSSSNSPGSALFADASTKIINMIRVAGQPATRAEMVQQQLKDIDPNIVLTVSPGFGGKEKAILTGRVKNTSAVSKAVNLTSIFYGTPGLKVLTGPGGNRVDEEQSSNPAGQGGGGQGGGGQGGGGQGMNQLIGNLANNVLHGSIITDTSGNVVSMMEVEERPQIKCTIKFLEVRKTKNLDFSASTLLSTDDVKASTYAGGTAALTPQGLVSQVSGANAAQVGILFGSDLATLLNGLITDGKARVLAEPTITSLSGEPSSFLAGGEFPIPVIGTNGGVSVIFREFGIRLNVLPTVTDRGTIHMQVSPEVSSLDSTAGVNINGLVVPGLRTRRSQTVLEMKDGENFVLSGLYNEEMSDIYAKTPFLGQIPILGNLFRSRAFQRAETEMVIVIQPQIQNHMNLSNLNTKPAVTHNGLNTTTQEVRQVVRINPNDVYQLKPSQKLVVPTTAGQSPESTATLTTKPEDPKATPAANSTTSADSKPTVTAQPPLESSANPTTPKVYMAQTAIAPAPNKLDSWFQAQKDALAGLISNLTKPEAIAETPAETKSGKTQPSAALSVAPVPPAKAEAKPPTQTPVVKTEVKPAPTKAKTEPAKETKATEPKKLPVAEDTKQKKEPAKAAVSTKPVKSAKTSATKPAATKPKAQTPKKSYVSQAPKTDIFAPIAAQPVKVSASAIKVAETSANRKQSTVQGTQAFHRYLNGVLGLAKF